jgi:hypothetical protein
LVICKIIAFRDIHIKFEDSIFGRAPYSFGFTLDSLYISTTDEGGQKGYVDRTKKENKGKPLFKILEINKAAFYWISRSKELIEPIEDISAIEAIMKKQADSSLMKSSKYILQPSILNNHLNSHTISDTPAQNNKVR